MPETAKEIPNNTVSQIREFKKLLDDGILTHEEFVVKKKQLLNL